MFTLKRFGLIGTSKEKGTPMRIFIAALATLIASSAYASTWNEEDYANNETPVTAKDRLIFQAARECAKPSTTLGKFFANDEAFAFFRVTKDKTVYRLWGPAAERAFIDRCQIQ